MDKKRPSGEQNLVTWARPYLADNKRKPPYQLVDPRLELNYSLRGVQKVSQLAYNCLSRDSKSRPTMDEVVKVLTPLQDLNDLAILSHHSRLSQQGRRKKKSDGTPQITYTHCKSIRDSPLNTGKQLYRWWAIASLLLAQLFDETKVWMPPVLTGMSEDYISSLYNFWVFEFCQSIRDNGLEKVHQFPFLKPLR